MATAMPVAAEVERHDEDAAVRHDLHQERQPGDGFDADGARHAFISSPSDAVHSGFITQPPQDRIGLPQAPLSATRFRVTFTQPGAYQYKCVLHDELGMVGEIIVLP